MVDFTADQAECPAGLATFGMPGRPVRRQCAERENALAA
jgi:hypothetical protein